MEPLIPQAEKKIAKAFADYQRAVEELDDDIDVPEDYDPEELFLEQVNAVVRKLMFDSVIVALREVKFRVSEMVKDVNTRRDE